MNTIRDVRSAGLATAAETGAALIFLHDYGSNEHDPSSLAELLGLELPWAALRDPLELGHGTAAWFPITTPGVPEAAPVESFPLCGQELERYDEYFEDRLELLLKIRDQNPVSWRGTTRAALDQLGVWPPRAVPCSPAARTRSWRRSCGNTMCWAMPASWPRCGWAGCPGPDAEVHRIAGHRGDAQGAHGAGVVPPGPPVAGARLKPCSSLQGEHGFSRYVLRLPAWQLRQRAVGLNVRGVAA